MLIRQEKNKMLKKTLIGSTKIAVEVMAEKYLDEGWKISGPPTFFEDYCDGTETWTLVITYEN